eukprot:Skav229949  [mRNA]  locus=scaffold2665:176073:177371:- [translate_table: standard]
MLFQWLLLPALVVDGQSWGRWHRGHQGWSHLRGTEDWRQCGILGKGPSSENPKTRIVHGQDADECVWRWQVSLSTPRDQFCGGSLIAPGWVLTAAHCVADIRGACAVRALRIHAGSRMRLPGAAGSEVTRHAKRIFVHPLYSQNVQHDYDFAIIQLDKAMPSNQCIGTICLPHQDERAGTQCNITGWGTLKQFGEAPKVLQEAAVTLLPDSECEQNYRESTEVITGSMLCASGLDAKKRVVDSCQGDSGGPLSCQEKGKFVLRGVTSWGQGCGSPNFPGVYGKVQSVMSWIEDVTGDKVKPNQDDEHQEAANISGIDFNGSMWAVVKGNCTKDSSGCIMSPGFPQNYTAQSLCVIAVNSSAAVPIKVVNFSTEHNYDSLISDCQYFSGKKGPEGIVPQNPMFWYSDELVTSSGWKLCPGRPSEAIQTSRHSP